jgi:hypothetical protein
MVESSRHCRPFFTPLLGDLHQRALLEVTLVVLVAEFWRTPHIEMNPGSERYTRPFTVADKGRPILDLFA